MGIKEDDRPAKKGPTPWVVGEEVEASLKNLVLENATLDELDDLEDEEDDTVLAKYREKRLAELRQQALVQVAFFSSSFEPFWSR